MAPGFLELLSDAERELVVRVSRRSTYPAGWVAHNTSDGQIAVVVERGLLRVFVMSTDGRQASVAYLHPTDAWGEPKMFGPMAPVELQAVTETTVLLLDGAEVDRLAETSPDVTEAVTRTVGGEFAKLVRLVTVRSLGSMTERLAFDLLERACATQLRGGQLLLSATHEELANSIGSSREVVTRIIGDLRHAGIVETSPGRILIKDAPRLSAIVHRVLMN